MKIKIKNYRTIKNAEININENKINYLLGANESGKSNVLNAIRIPDLDNQENFVVNKKDKTLENNNYINEPIKIIVEKNNSTNSFPSTGPKQVSWFYENSNFKNEYIKKINEYFKNNKNNLIDQVNKKYNKQEIWTDTREEILTLIEQISNNKYVSCDERKKL